MSSSTRILIVSLLISLLGHLIIFTALSVITPEERERPPELARISFLGELRERRVPSLIEVVAREDRPELQPLIREVGVGPGLILIRPSLMVPAPQISLKEILSFPQREEDSLLQVGIAGERKETPPFRSRLLERE